ncbi:MAG TPA: GyrI-like domain-containing protein, partial [Elusimicrobiales bacterium]|nr:GyrI-like domain-containing protein [Elusimicrobiales bacterium]
AFRASIEKTRYFCYPIIEGSGADMGKLKGIIGCLIILIVLTSLAVKYSCEEAYLKRFDSLKNPQIISKPNQYVLIINYRGFHGNVLKASEIKKLYKIASRVKDPMQDQVLKSRWQDPKDADKAFVGSYALTIKPNLKIIEEGTRSELWEYGDVAEILHIGPYSKINESVEKLKKFISDNEYRIKGEYEEEYIKGPGKFFKGNENKYRTIIRFKVSR